MPKKKGGTKKKKKGVIFKVVDNCRKCGIKLKKNNKYHIYCDNCWKEIQLEKGNLILIGGVK